MPQLPTILDTVGNTPLVRLQRLPAPDSAAVLAKLEGRNPAGSVKDRIALAMVEDAERDGRLRPGDTLIEATSGNTGIGLAMVAAARGYRLILTMPDNLNPERLALFRLLGAEVKLTPAVEGMSGAVYAAEELARQGKGLLTRQFDNPANPEAHRLTTAREILQQTQGQIDAFVAGVGTGGTLTGVGEVLKQECPGARIVAVEPASSPVLSGGRPGQTRIHGLGAGFQPGILNRDVIDEVLTVTDEEAIAMTRRLGSEEGILAGFSSGAACHAALRVARQLGPGKNVVVIFPDSADRYLSMLQVAP